MKYLIILLSFSIALNIYLFNINKLQDKIIKKYENTPVNTIETIKYIDKIIYLKPTENPNLPIAVNIHESDPYTVQISTKIIEQKIEIIKNPKLLLHCGLLKTNTIDLFCGLSYNIYKDTYISFNSDIKNKHNLSISVKIF